MTSFRYWMHGMAKENATETARALVDAGFSVVVAGGEANVRAVADVGMESWLCGGAFRIQSSEADYLAVSITGEPREWFRSGCPNEPAIRARNIEQYRALAATEAVAGVLVDGCRFASPASGLDAFLTCFCPRCEKRAADTGFDSEAMRRDVMALREAILAGADSATLVWRASPSGLLEWLVAHPGIGEWLRFRAACAGEHMAEVSAAIRESGKRVGMYAFTPSLAPLVGQSYRDLAPHVDVFAPMIYRNYPKSPGPACLNWELTNIVEEAGLEGTDEEAAMRATLRWVGLETDVDELSIAAVRRGLPPSATIAETARARALLPESKELAPIVTIDDPEMPRVVEGVRDAGAQGINFFSFQDNWAELLKGVTTR